MYLPHRHKYPPNQHRKQAPKKGASELESQSLARSCQRGHIACQPSRSFAIQLPTFSPPPKRNHPRSFKSSSGSSPYRVTKAHITTLQSPFNQSHLERQDQRFPTMLDKLVGFAMLVAASVIFLYYTIWTLLMPFVDDDHPLQNLFLPRVWAIRIPVILLLLGSAVVGSFVGMVMIRSNQKKAAKAKAAAKKKA
ncbi:hypothetical protein Trihar35433_1153 [Trichoderma harzianum]|nr:hypothetical protein Trihar35433_1153 [Trichoderma harzianum]